MKWKMYLSQGCLMMLMRAALADTDVPTFDIEINQHIFEPEVVLVPANTKVKLIIHNHDATPEELKSRSLNLKKIILGHSDVVVYIGPLRAGDYQYAGAFYPRSANGVVHAEIKSTQSL
jgi:hypothetical protein